MLNYKKELSQIIATEKGYNIRVAALSAFVSQQKQIENTYTFCKDPLNFVWKGNLGNYVGNLENYIADIKEEAERLPAFWEKTGTPTRLGYQTDFRLFDKPTEQIKGLIEILKKEIREYQKNFNQSDCGLIKYWPSEIKLQGWYVRLKTGGQQLHHLHSNGWLSGVLYLKTVDAVDEEGASNSRCIKMTIKSPDMICHVRFYFQLLAI